MLIHDENIGKLSCGGYIVATVVMGLKQNCVIFVKITANTQMFEVTLITGNFEFLYLRKPKDNLYTCFSVMSVPFN